MGSCLGRSSESAHEQEAFDSNSERATPKAIVTPAPAPSLSYSATLTATAAATAATAAATAATAAAVVAVAEVDSAHDVHTDLDAEV